MAYNSRVRRQQYETYKRNREANLSETERLRELAFLDGLEAELEQAKERRKKQPLIVRVTNTNAHIPRREIF